MSIYFHYRTKLKQLFSSKSSVTPTKWSLEQFCLILHALEKAADILAHYPHFETSLKIGPLCKVILHGPEWRGGFSCFDKIME